MRSVCCLVVIPALLLIFSCSVFAQGSELDIGFEDAKTKKIMNINARISVLEAERECIAQSKISQDMKKCKYDAFRKRVDLAIEPREQRSRN